MVLEEDTPLVRSGLEGGSSKVNEDTPLVGGRDSIFTVLLPLTMARKILGGRMIIEYLENSYRAEAELRNHATHNVFRASSAGYCERRLGYDKMGVRGDPLTPRRVSVFRHGSILDGGLKSDLQEALGDKFLNLDNLGVNRCQIGNVEVTFTPDGAFQTETGEIGIVEIKTMSDYAFDRALKGEIDHAYLCQAWVYAESTSFNPVVFICYRKETSHMVEVIFDRNASETVVVQRYGGDPMELATNDPLLIAEIKTPFDGSVQEEVRAKFARLNQLNGEIDLTVGERKIEHEEVRVQGKVKAMETEKTYGPPTRMAGSWFTFNTGRQIAGFPCSYCPHIRRCLGANLEIKNGKPIWVIEGGNNGDQQKSE